VLTLQISGANSELALTKTVTTHPIKNYIEHVDLLLVRRGEKVTVDIPVLVTGDATPGTLVTQDLAMVQIEVDALRIPEQLEISIDGARAGTQILAGQVRLPDGATLVSDPEALVIAVNVAPTAEQLEGEVAAPVEEPVTERPQAESTEPAAGQG
jgi:large subunit ribosomal protein L25